MKNPRKRLTSTYFLERYRHFLTDGGTIHLKTDSNFLFTYTDALVSRNGLPVVQKTTDLYAADYNTADYAKARSIQTYYEQMWLERGLNIKYLRFRLPAAGPLEEPDIEIPLDDYRSYHRTKRSSLETAK
jgi:tRNA (guanine-N7-)-methyltransferase